MLNNFTSNTPKRGVFLFSSLFRNKTFLNNFSKKYPKKGRIRFISAFYFNKVVLTDFSCQYPERVGYFLLDLKKFKQHFTQLVHFVQHSLLVQQ